MRGHFLRAAKKGSEVVTSGLLLHYDTANTSSYPGSGTSITNLVNGGNTGTLTNGVGFDSGDANSLTFTAASDHYIDVSATYTLTAATITAWIKTNGTQIAYGGIVYNRQSAGRVSGLMIAGTVTRIGYTWNDQSATFSFLGPTFDAGQWNMATVTVTSTTAELSLRRAGGTLVETNTTTHALQELGAIQVGRDSFGSRNYNGKIGKVLIYDRALTSTELDQNFEADRARFGV